MQTQTINPNCENEQLFFPNKWASGGEIGNLRSVKRAQERGGWGFKVGETLVSEYGGPKRTTYHIAPTDIPEHWGRIESLWGGIDFYDPEHAHEEDGRVVSNDQEADRAALPTSQQEGLIYRGMSWEEYQGALKSGEFRSRGEYNIVDLQEGLTMWSSDPQKASVYANDFAPWQFKATPSRPAVLVALKDPGEEHHVYTVPFVTKREIGLKCTQPTSDISHAFVARPVIIQAGRIEVKNHEGGRMQEGGCASPRVHVRWTLERRRPA
jgi:hypothetical protein